MNSDSVVFDVGGFRGDFAAEIHDRYRCRIHVFEPVRAYYDQLVERFRDCPQIAVHPYGLGGHSDRVWMSVEENRSSHAASGPGTRTEPAEIVSFDECAQRLGIGAFDLVKINIEGAEYDLLGHLIASRWVERIRDLQVQFHHFVPDATRRRSMLRRQLRLTHRTTYDFYFVWENWCRLPNLDSGASQPTR